MEMMLHLYVTRVWNIRPTIPRAETEHPPSSPLAIHYLEKKSAYFATLISWMNLQKCILGHEPDTYSIGGKPRQLS